MSNHNYSQYSNNKKKKNYSKPKVEDTAVENVLYTEPDAMSIEPTIPEVVVVNETVETVTLPTTVVGTVSGCAKLNVRAKPAVDGDVLAVLEANSKVEIDPARSTNEWLKITTAAGVNGFCMRKFVNAKL